MTAVAAPRGRSLRRFVQAREVPVVTVLVVVALVTTILNHRFLAGQGRRDLMLEISYIALMAVGETFVIIMRHVDLSVGSTLGLSAYVSAVAAQHAPPGAALAVIAVVGAAVGIAVGVVNGVLVATLRLPALVVTLGTLYVVRGIQGIVVGAHSVNASQLPQSIVTLGTATFLGIPLLMWIVVVVALAATPLAHSTRMGRDLYAMGSNPDAAVRVGVPIVRRTITGFALSGCAAGLAGAVYLSKFGHVDVTAGKGYELSVVAACVVGGVFIFGGSGSPIGAVIGALLLGTIGASMTAVGVSEFWQLALVGVLIVGAISIDRVAVVRAEQKRRREPGR